MLFSFATRPPSTAHGGCQRGQALDRYEVDLGELRRFICIELPISFADLPVGGV
jgi:hypothetical protein